MEIRPLADWPDLIPLLAKWFHSEWNVFDGRSYAEIESQLRMNLNRDEYPTTFLAFAAGELVGTVSLDDTDLPGYENLSPWLASLYVVPSHRRAGIGKNLIHHLIAFADQRAVSPIYLWTPGPTRLYEDCGWKYLRLDVYAGHPITLMSRP